VDVNVPTLPDALSRKPLSTGISAAPMIRLILWRSLEVEVCHMLVNKVFVFACPLVGPENGPQKWLKGSTGHYAPVVSSTTFWDHIPAPQLDPPMQAFFDSHLHFFESR
jgi:hypothetical protein